MSNEIVNREHWLNELAKRLEPMLKAQGHKIPAYRITCGWPANRGMAAKNQCIGQCFVTGSVAKVKEIFISPVLDKPDEVAHVTLHEMAHAVLPPGVGHKAPFARLAVALGLEGKPTATHAGDKLTDQLRVITDALGPYPHDRIDTSGMKKQTTRLLKVICPECGYTIRVTSKWISEAGLPICPCGVKMEEDTGEEIENPLMVVDQTVEFKLRHNTRFAIRLSRTGKRSRWFIIDYHPEDSSWPETVAARVTPAESREDALDLIVSLQEGLLTYGDLGEQIDDIDVEDPIEGEADPEADWNDLHYLDDDEEEDPDYEDGHVDPEEEEAFAAEQAKRESWVS